MIDKIMLHVKSICKIASYPTGTIFAVVKTRKYLGTTLNSYGTKYLTDGMWIGDFPPNSEKSLYTSYCISEAGFNDNKSDFVIYKPTENDRINLLK